MLLATKPKSSIDDLFADADSDEDSDIFSSRNIVKKRSKEPTVDDNNRPAAKDFLNVGAIGNIATSTPESNINVPNLFNDDENDDTNLFGSSKKQFHKAVTTPSSINSSATQESIKKVNY